MAVRCLIDVRVGAKCIRGILNALRPIVTNKEFIEVTSAKVHGSVTNICLELRAFLSGC